MITRDEIIKMAREAGFGPAVAWKECTPPFERLVHAAYEAGAAAERERIESERLPSPLRLWGGCPVCSIGSKPGVYGVVCNRGDCPTRVTCTGAV